MKRKKLWLLAAGLVFLGGALIIPTIASFAGEDVDALKKEIEALRAEVAELKSNQKVQARAATASSPKPWPQKHIGFFDPFAEMHQMQARMNQLFNDSLMRSSLFDDSLSPSGFGSFFEPDLEMKEKENQYEFSFDLPGLEKDRIDLEVTEHALTISGERSFEQKEEDEKEGYYRMERSYGSFHRSVPLPEDANPEEVKAEYDKGVLTVTIGKQASETSQKEVRKIQIT